MIRNDFKSDVPPSQKEINDVILRFVDAVIAVETVGGFDLVEACLVAGARELKEKKDRYEINKMD